MKITRIEIKNFRLLREFSLDLEKELSLVIGKNNSGKTSFLTALDKFLNASEKTRISYDDFNADLKNTLIQLLIDGVSAVTPDSEYVPLCVRLKIFIEYDEDDDLANVRPLIMGLDVSDNHIVLGFDYEITHSKLVEMCIDYESVKTKYQESPALYLREKQHDYFSSIKRKSYLYADSAVFLDLNKELIGLQDVISFKCISAKRSVTNKESDKTLSAQTSSIYRRTSQNLEQVETVEEFKAKLRRTDDDLSEIYKSMFSDLLKKVSKFGGIKDSETHIKIASTLQHRELLEGNTTVLYTHDSHDLPEHFNGLGYMNLISMIFEIEMQMTAFRRSGKERSASINLLFIEEPEAHTHPQMQYVFIKNIKDLLLESRKREDGIDIHLQTIISTHSSHIVAECDFDDIKYLKKSEDERSVDAKSLTALKSEYASSDEKENTTYIQHFKFLKQYLTLNRAELFFADKAILIEGDTERLLLPAMMKKLDQENSDPNLVPLLSQNISVVEVGAHAQIFQKFIHFVGIKTLVITDIDSCFTRPEFESDGKTVKKYANGNEKKELVKCSPAHLEASQTTNSSLISFHGKTRDDLKYFLELKFQEKILSRASGTWKPDPTGKLTLVYQTEEDGYHGRSFEDTFFKINKKLLGKQSDCFPSLVEKWFNQYVNDECTTFEFAEKGVGSKPSLAIEILLNSTETPISKYSNWAVPHYIQEGLEWLRN